MLSKKEEQELLTLQLEEENYWKHNKLNIYYGENDYTNPNGKIICGRDKYPKHVNFFNAGKEYILRAFIAGNQTGKSLAGCIEDVYHATGLYPKWWKGYRFTKPVTIWLCGDRAEAIRDGLQVKLYGESGSPNTGLIPEKLLIDKISYQGVAGTIGVYKIKHVSGGISTITIKTYQSGRTAFESAVVDIIHLDEECPRDIFSECITRTADSNGILYLTFTPDSGLTDTVTFFLDKEDGVRKSVTMVGWDDVPHLSSERKKILLASYSPHERDCRTKGIPYLGHGKIYNLPEDKFIIDPIEINRWWPRVYGMDIGYSHPTACVWMAHDRESDRVIVYSEYKQAQVEPATHANAIINRGAWIPGIVDTTANEKGSASRVDGTRLIDLYNKFGLSLFLAQKKSGSVEEGILEIYDRLTSDRLKIFSTCTQLIDELRIYRRDDRGNIVKKNDDLLDAWRYGITTGLMCAITEPNPSIGRKNFNNSGKSEVGGY